MLALLTLIALADPVPVNLVRVAAAADLRFALDELVARYEKVNPNVDVRVSYGSSGNFFAQLSEGAPFDVFLSADIDYPSKLVASGVCAKDSLFPYAVGRIVLWAKKGSVVDPQQGLRALVDAKVKKIAIANPRHAPYGRAATAALEHAAVSKAVQDKLVFGENVSQAAQLAESGAADAGIIAKSLALSPAMSAQGTWWEVPADSYPKLLQGGCVIAKGNRARASAVRELLLADEGREVLRRFGFLVP